jgi:hypothetical protein
MKRIVNILLLVFIGFALGFVTRGAFMRGRWGSAEKREAYLVERLDSYVGLSETQAEKVKQLLVDARGKFQEMRKESEPRINAIREQTSTEIRAQLTQEQQPKFEEFLKERAEKRQKWSKKRPRWGSTCLRHCKPQLV